MNAQCLTSMATLSDNYCFTSMTHILNNVLWNVTTLFPSLWWFRTMTDMHVFRIHWKDNKICHRYEVILAKEAYKYDVAPRALCIHEPCDIWHCSVELHSWTHGDQKRENYCVRSAWHILCHTITLPIPKRDRYVNKTTVLRSSIDTIYHWNGDKKTIYH